VIAPDPAAIARELATAYERRQIVATPPSQREAPLDLDAAYAVEGELVRMRRGQGRRTVGRKVGYANKAVWRALKLETLVWARMYDDTVRFAPSNDARLPLDRLVSPKIEPEIVLKLARGPAPDATEPAAVLDAVEWLALGFEIVDCIYPDWKFQPADFVAAYGLHAALVVGTPLAVTPANIAQLADALPRFTLTLTKDGQPAAEGSGKNSLRSPALCLAELAAAAARRPGSEPLAGGELVSTGSLTEAQPLGPGETWTASVDGIELAALTMRT
jgi:2-oxo-3-hexenedioate decarboxylase